MTNPTRPLPRLEDPDTAEFWRRTKDGQLCFQRCADCSSVVFFPRRHCSGCGSANLSWETAAGTGTIYSYSVIRQSYHPFFRGEVPYAVAWIDLDEGPRLLSNVVGMDDPGQLRIGQRVTLIWEPHEELAIPLFSVS